MENIWNNLLDYETRDLLDRYTRTKFGKKLTERKAIQIASNFSQAREYFRSAELSNFTVQPLLQYYGIMGLSKGLILFLNTGLTEDQLRSSHGLEVKNWKEVLNTRKFEDLQIKICDGTFRELLDCTDNVNYLRANSTKVNYRCRLNPPSNSDIITLKELIQYFPDLSQEYKSWLNSNLTYYTIKTLNGEKRIVVRIEGNQDIESIESVFPDEYCKSKTLKILNNNETEIMYEAEDWFPNLTQLWNGPFGIGDTAAIPVFKNDIGLNLLCGMYMISYVFGMLARYFPSVWINIRRIEIGDKLYPFASRVLDFISKKYPLQIYDFLKAPYEFEAEKPNKNQNKSGLS